MTDAAPPPEDPLDAELAALARPPRWRRRLKLSLALLVLLAAASEAALRRFVPRDTPLWSEHPFTLVVRNPDASARLRTWDGKSHVYSANALGFRSRGPMTRERPKDVYRIFVLGDELTDAADLPHEQTYAGLIEGQLDARRAVDELRVEVANAAAPHHGAEAVFATLAHRVLACQPDLVVVQTARVDALLSISETWDDLSLGWRAPPRESPSLGAWLCSVSDLAAFLHGRAVRFGAAPPSPAPRPVARLRPRQQAADWKRALPTYKQFLHRIAVLCRDAKADLVLCTQPTLLEENPSPEEAQRLAPVRLNDGPVWPHEHLRQALEAYDEEVRTAGAREGCWVADLARKVPRDLEHWTGAFSLTPRGHDAVARAVLDEAFPEGRQARRR